MKLSGYFRIAGALLAVDWFMGAAQAAGIIPLWSFLAVNFPFGMIYVWYESHWSGSQYLLSNHVISDFWPLLFFFIVVFTQAWIYYLLFGLLSNKNPD